MFISVSDTDCGRVPLDCGFDLYKNRAQNKNTFGKKRSGKRKKLFCCAKEVLFTEQGFFSFAEITFFISTQSVVY